MKKTNLIFLVICFINGACGKDDNLNLYPPYGEVKVNDQSFIPEFHVLVKEYNSLFDLSTYQFILSDKEVSYNRLSERFNTEDNALILYISLTSRGDELTTGEYALNPFDAFLEKRINSISFFSPDENISFGPLLNQSLELDVRGDVFTIRLDSIQLLSPERLINGTLEGRFDNVFSPLIQ